MLHIKVKVDLYQVTGAGWSGSQETIRVTGRRFHGRTVVSAGSGQLPRKHRRLCLTVGERVACCASRDPLGVENLNAVHSPHAAEASRLCMRQAIPSMARNSSTCVTRHYSTDIREAWVILSHTCRIRDIPWAILI